MQKAGALTAPAPSHQPRTAPARKAEGRSSSPVPHVSGAYLFGGQGRQGRAPLLIVLGFHGALRPATLALSPESGAHAIRVARVGVVVRIAGVVHIGEVRRVVRIDGALPPVVRGRLQQSDATLCLRAPHAPVTPSFHALSASSPSLPPACARKRNLPDAEPSTPLLALSGPSIAADPIWRRP